MEAGAVLEKTLGKHGNRAAIEHQAAMLDTYKRFYAELQTLPFDSKKRAQALAVATAEYRDQTKGFWSGDNRPTDAKMAALTKNLLDADAAAKEGTVAMESIIPPYEIRIESANVDEVQNNATALLTYSETYVSVAKDNSSSASCFGQVIQPVQFVDSEDQCRTDRSSSPCNSWTRRISVGRTGHPAGAIRGLGGSV